MIGTIKILDSNGEPANVNIIDDSHNTIERVKDRWRKKYGKKYSEDRIVIELNEPSKVIIAERKIERPEAVYSNPSFNS